MSRHRPTENWYALWDALNSEDEWHQFLVAFNKFCQCLSSGSPPKALERMPEELEVREIEGSSGIYQLKWGDTRYATFAFDPSDLDKQGNPRINWRTISKEGMPKRP